MKQRSRCSLVLLVLTLAGSEAWAARPRVRIEVRVDPALTLAQRWKKAGVLTKLENDIAANTVSAFDSKFHFVQWTTAPFPGPLMQLTLEENPNSPNQPGSRPWIVDMELTCGGGRHPYTLDVMKAADVYNLPKDDKASADVVAGLVPKQLRDGLVATEFVTKMLSYLDVAGNIQKMGDNVIIDVPACDLHTTSESVLNASFVAPKGTRTPSLHPIGMPPAMAVHDSWTECGLLNPSDKTILPDVKNVRKGSISFTLYKQDNGNTVKRGDVVEKCPP